MARTYDIEPHGKKFATVCRTDGFWTMTLLSKNKKAAIRKGDEFVKGIRTATFKYTTAFGRAVNEEKSRNPRRASWEIIAAVAATFHGEMS